MTGERLPPQDIDAEEATLGSLLIDQESMAKVVTLLRFEDFYREKNRWVYEACVGLHARNEPIDQLTVAHELERAKKLEAVGGAAYLSHLVGVVPTSVHIEHYAQIVYRMSMMRRLIAAGLQIADIGYEAQPDIDSALSKAQDILFRFSSGQRTNTIVTPSARAEFALDMYQKMASNERPISLPFGFKCLDRLGGMQPGEMIIVAGETEMGKTALLSQIARGVQESANVLFCSVEMTLSQMTHRDIARILGEYIRVIGRGGYSEGLADRILGQGVGELAKERIYYYNRGAMTVPEIHAIARRMQMEHGLGVVIVDYLQRLRDSEKGGTLYERTTNISKALKEMAVELEVPVLVASQLSRSHTNTKPTLDRLRDSGRIEEDADWVIFIHRDCEKGSDKASLIVAKHRQGGEHLEQDLTFVRREQRYEEIEQSVSAARSSQE